MMRHWNLPVFALFAGMLMQSSLAFASFDKTWYETKVAEASTGLELSPPPRTIITEVWLEAVGPSEIPREFENALLACLGIAYASATGAYQTTAGGPLAQASAAFAAFKTTLVACGVAVPATVLDKYTLVLSLRQRQQNGIDPKIETKNPFAVFIPKGTPKEAEEAFNKGTSTYQIPKVDLAKYFGVPTSVSGGPAAPVGDLINKAGDEIKKIIPKNPF